MSAAKQADKEELCAKIGGTGAQSECYAFFGKKDADAGVCLKASGAGRDDCLKAVAKALEDLSLCQGVSDSATRRNCFETVGQAGENRQVLLKLAGFCAAAGDADAQGKCAAAAEAQAYTLDYCDPVADQNRMACLMELNKIVRDRALCDKFADPKAKNDCIIGAAGKQGQAAACGELKEQAQKFDCLKAVAVGAHDEKICKSIELSGPGVQTRWDCLEEVAQAKQDASVCMPINFKEQRGRCVAALAIAKKDPGLCEQIKNDALTDKDPFQARDSCYLYLVHGAGDKPLCEKVQDAARKEKCLAQAAG